MTLLEWLAGWLGWVAFVTKLVQNQPPYSLLLGWLAELIWENGGLGGWFWGWLVLF